MLSASQFLTQAKVPRHLLPWKSVNRKTNAKLEYGHAFLFDVCMSGLHLVDEDGYGGYTIMEDSDREIRRHLGAIFAAKGRVLKTGLGFGCFVRACLKKPEVQHIDVVEIDQEIIAHFGAEFKDNERVTIHHADAFDFPLAGRQWDLAWHDIYCEGNNGLDVLHTELLLRYCKHAKTQGAWKLTRWASRLWFETTGQQLVGAPKMPLRLKQKGNRTH